MSAAGKLPAREELRGWREFIETTEQLRTALAARLYNDTGLSPSDYAPLLALSEATVNRFRSRDLTTCAKKGN